MHLQLPEIDLISQFTFQSNPGVLTIFVLQSPFLVLALKTHSWRSKMHPEILFHSICFTTLQLFELNHYFSLPGLLHTHWTKSWNILVTRKCFFGAKYYITSLTSSLQPDLKSITKLLNSKLSFTKNKSYTLISLFMKGYNVN